MTDPLFRLLASLPAAEPDSARVDRVRARCHAALNGRRPPRSPRPSGARLSWQAFVASLGGAYLTETIRQVLRLYGVA
ncbi:MAG TPA: hypothetical protein VK886_05735 [Vicinamibacterales bacterium]|nr:hypothetical protein [Vicinamibacterales bacterium]